MKHKISIYFLTCCFLSIFCFVKSQNKMYNNWVFGDHAGLNFNTSPPSFINNCSLNSLEACASISDNNGALLFYSDGDSIWNKNHQLMQNGTGLLGHKSTTQGANIVPYPNHPNLYYLFAINRENGFLGGCACLSYSIIDMNLNNGLGVVISKNNILHNQITEKLSVVKHPNDTSYWVVAHDYGSNQFLSYLIDTNGINTTPLINAIGSSICCNSNFVNGTGQMKISPNCERLALVNTWDGILELFNINSSTGAISNPVTINLNNQYIYGLEFSNNSNIIYITTWRPHDSYLFQLDISSWNSTTIASSINEIYHSTTTTYGQLQMAPDNKIYCAGIYDNSVNTINNSNQMGWQCGFQRNALYLNSATDYGISLFGFPNRISMCNTTNANPISGDTICDITIPNVLTPNNDNVNEYFYVVCHNKNYAPQDLIIYNRWGQEIFNAQKKLDLTRTVNDGTYYYTFSFQEIKHKGFLEIFH